MEYSLGRNVHGESRFSIELTGSYEVLRFAVNMLSHQVEFCRAGRVVLVELREQVGVERFDPWAASILGAERFEKLRPHYMERDTHCCCCEREVPGDEPRRLLSQAQIVCVDCDPDDITPRAPRAVTTVEMPAPDVIDGSPSDLDVPLLDSDGYLPCGCLGAASEHTCEDQS